MKRVIVALSMLAFAFASSFFFAYLLNKNISGFTAEVSHLASVSQTASIDEINTEAKQIIEKWNKTQKFLKIITVHENLNVLTENIRSLDGISASGNRDYLNEKCNEICIMLSVFADDEKSAGENVF